MSGALALLLCATLPAHGEALGRGQTFFEMKNLSHVKALAATMPALKPEVPASRTPDAAPLALTAQQNTVVQAALAGDAQAQSDVGIMFYTADGLPKNDTQAAKWFKLSADQGNADGLYNLGMAYLNGIGVRTDEARAVQYLTDAAYKGQPTAQFMLGSLTGAGYDGHPADDTLSIAWIKTAAKNGNAQAIDMLDMIGDAMPDDISVASDAVAGQLQAGLSAGHIDLTPPAGSVRP